MIIDHVIIIQETEDIFQKYRN